MSLLLRRQSLLAPALRPRHPRHPRNGPPSAASMRCASSGLKKLWPAVHPQRKRLRRQMIDVRRGKDPEAVMGDVCRLDGAPEPTRRQLFAVGLHQGIPFVGFGIMDNAILLLAGEAIDVYLGVALGISTMCAAAIGNIVSDLAGVAFGTVIEDALLNCSREVERLTGGRVKLPPVPKLSHEQRNLRSVRLSGQLGCAVGLTVGCIIGMFPLLFFSAEEKRCPKEKKEECGEAKQVIINNRQNDELTREIGEWKGKHAEAMERLRVLEAEKNDGLWDRGY